MNVQEFNDRFDVLYNNITSSQAPGLNDYEISLFLTKAQDEIIKNYFNPKGNKYQEGYDDNAKRQVDFSMLTKVFNVENIPWTYQRDPLQQDGEGHDTYIKVTQESSQNTPVTYRYVQAYDSNGDPIADHYVRDSSKELFGFNDALYDNRENSKSVVLPSDLMLAINERVVVKRNGSSVNLVVVPINFAEYNRLMTKPFKRPIKYQAWRLINSTEAYRADLVVGPSDTIKEYTLRYVKRPNPIIVSMLDDDVKINGEIGPSECELDPILHEEILQRAVELAKLAWQGDVNAAMQGGQRSE